MGPYMEVVESPMEAVEAFTELVEVSMEVRVEGFCVVLRTNLLPQQPRLLRVACAVIAF